jgi:hypothetical protein
VRGEAPAAFAAMLAKSTVETENAPARLSVEKNITNLS